MEAVRPTFVIGVGEAGWKMIDDINQIAEEQLGDAAESFDYAMIDTNGSDMRSDGPMHVAYPIDIEKPPDEWNDDVKKFHYLSDTLNPLSSGDTGAKKQRPLGRYQVEKQGQREKIRQQLRGQITTHLEDIGGMKNDDVRSNGELSIWIVNSLGGGTGSGTFPVVTEIVTQLIANDLNNINTYLYGIGGTPETKKGPEAKAELPEPEHRMNTYTALRELLAIVRPNQAREPVRYPEESMFDEREELRGDPFENYFLLGHDPTEDKSDKYLHKINRAAGILITYLAQSGGLEDFPFVNIDGEDDTLLAVDAYQIHAPVESTGGSFQSKSSIESISIESIVERSNEIDNTRSKIEELEETKDTLKTTRQAIHDLNPDEQNYASFSAEKLAEETEIPSDFLKAFESSTGDLSTQDIYTEETGKEFDIDEQIDEHISNSEITTYLDGSMKQELFDPVIRFVYGTYLQIRLEQLQHDHEFYEQMEDEWQKLSRADEIDPRDDKVGTFNQFGNDPLEAYNTEIRDALTRIHDEYEEKSEEQGALGSIVGTDWGAETRKIEKRIEKYDATRNEYSILKSVHDTASSRTETAWSELKERADELSDDIEEIKNKIGNRQGDIDAELRAIQTIFKQLQSGSTEDRYHRLPMVELDVPLNLNLNDPESVNQVSSATDVYSGFDSIGGLLNEYIDPEDLGTAAKQVLTNLDTPPVQDTSTTDVATVFGITTGSADTDTFLNQNINEQETVSEVIGKTGEFNRSDHALESQDSFSIWVLGLYTDLTVEDMYEVSYFDTHFTDETKNIDETPLGKYNPSKVTDSELAARFAYPEFLSEEYERNVREKADMGPSPAEDGVKKLSPED